MIFLLHIQCLHVFFSDFLTVIILTQYFSYNIHITFQNCFDFPNDPEIQVSDEAKDLMKKLICSAEQRLGQTGINDFKVMSYTNNY